MKLHDYITAHLGASFCYGRLDCVLFAHGYVKQATGIDYLADVPKWENERQALRQIKGVGGLEAAIDARLTRVNPHMAKDGDIALYEGSVCLFSGPHIVGPGINGLQFIDRMKATCAWSI